MPVLIAIPARYASTRYPGKPLVELRGADGDIQKPDPPELGRGNGGAGDRPGRGCNRRCSYSRRSPRLWRRSDHDLRRLPQRNGTLCRGFAATARP